MTSENSETPLTDNVLRLLSRAPGHVFQDRDKMIDLSRSFERQLREVKRVLGDVISSAHDNGRLLTGGKLHPTATWEDCPSMLCEDVRTVLRTGGRPKKEKAQ